MKRPLNQDGTILWRLFWSFLKISPVSFGGGYAMLPAIHEETVTHRRWMSDKEMAEAISVSGAAPGGIGVNAAAYIGFKVMGWRGLAAAVLGMMLPTFLIVLALGIVFDSLRYNPKVIAALQGIQIAVIALIVYAAIRMAYTSLIDKTTSAVFIVGFAMLAFLGLYPILLIPIGIVVGLVLVKFKENLRLTVIFEREKRVSSHSKTIYAKFPDHYYGDGI